MSDTALLRRPEASSLSELLESLIEKEALVRPVTWEAPLEEPLVIGAYEDNHNRVVAVIAMDLSIGRYLGAALSSIPKDFIPDGMLSGTMYENLVEVLNVATGVFQTDECRVCLREVVRHPDTELADEVADVFNKHSYQETLGVTVEGYGTGRFVVAIADGMVGNEDPQAEQALEGSTHHVRVDEILGFLGQQGKSGVLEVEAPDEKFRLILAQGSVLDLNINGQELGETLIDFLERHEDADPTIFHAMRDKFSGRPVELAWEAARVGLVPRVDVELAIENEVSAVFQRLLELETARFSFTEADPAEFEGKICLSVTHLLLEGARRRDDENRDQVD